MSRYYLVLCCKKVFICSLLLGSSGENVDFPVIIINFKTYPEALGRKGEELVGVIDRVKAESGVNLAVAVGATMLQSVSENSFLNVFAQHFDPLPDSGRNTGFVTASQVAASGASGALLNHPEHPLDIRTIELGIKQARENNLFVIVGANDVNAARAVAALKPDAVAFEVPELIGTGKSISKARPDLVREVVDAVSEVSDVPVLCGAGVSTGDDVRAALECGASGVLLATAVVKAENPYAKLIDLVGGVKE